MRIVITGATGLIGRNLLFEVIKQNLGSLDELEIVILGRGARGADIRQRISEIIMNDGLEYMSLKDQDVGKLEKFCKTGIRGMNMTLEGDGLGISPDDIEELNSTPIDIFFHLAALTDLRDTPAVEKMLKKINVDGTRKVLEMLSSLNKVVEFCYVGTAYSCGSATGRVSPDKIDLDQKFRNPYEKSKLEAEIMVRDFSRRTGIKCRYFRPSVTCGRLMEPVLGAINKFDVFYAWAGFFLQMKLKQLNDPARRYEEPVNVDLGICYNQKSGLNIVPVDYVAKVMYQVCAQKDPGESYHLVNDTETPHSLYIPIMLDKLKITGTRHMSGKPGGKNRFESLYYKTAGKVFSPYITSDPIHFDTDNLRDVLVRSGLSCPPIDNKTFSILMDYAKERDFGFDLGGPKASR